MNKDIFAQVDTFLEQTFSLEDDVLIAARQSVASNGMPEHSVSANQGQMLYLLATMCQAKRIIEVGTLGGYSTIWLARALAKGGNLTSIEVDAEYAAVASRNIALAGLSDRVTIKVGTGMDVLNELKLDPEPVDLFFMDADKPNYCNYFDIALSMARKGSLIIADNVIRSGKILEPQSNDEKVLGVQQFIKHISADNRVITSVLQTVGDKEHDGIAISLVL